MSDPTKTIDTYLASLPLWQKKNLEDFRALVHGVDPNITEDWKWSVPVFMLNKKMMFAMAAFKAHTKYNFIGNGALIDDVDNLFNNGFESKKSRGIDLKENETIDQVKLRGLINRSIGTAR